MTDAIKDELGKYWDNLPKNLSHQEEVFLLKVSHAIDYHKAFGTEPEPYLSSVETLLDMHKNIADAGSIIEEESKNMKWNNLEGISKLQRMIELPYFINAQSFEINNDLPQDPTPDDIKKFKDAFHREQLECVLPAAYEVTAIRRADSSMKLEDAIFCFSAMQDRAVNHFGKTTGLKIIPDFEASNEENQIRHELHELVLRKPRETLVLTDGCDDTKIYGLSDLKAKLESVEDRAKSVDPLDLDKSIDALQSNKQKGFSRQMGVGKELTLQEMARIEREANIK